MFQLYYSCSNFLTHKMMFYIDMFGACMEYRVVGQALSALIVDVQLDCCQLG